MKGLAGTWAARAFVMILAAFAAGCHGMGRYNVVVSCDEKLRNASVMVDLVGVNESEYDQWYHYPMSKYWSPRDRMREDAPRFEMKFGQGLPDSQTLSKKDPAWDPWNKKLARHLFVLADLSGVGDDQLGNVDPRRKILPLSKTRWRWKYFYWPVKQDIQILIKPSGVSVVTPAKSEAN